jgi:hypothetical protein
MKKNWVWLLIAGVLFVAIPVATSRAEIKAEIVIRGDIDELIEVLERLRDLGLGATVESANGSKIQLHSVMDEKEIGRGEIAPPPEPEVVGLAFLWARTEPKVVQAAGTVLVEAKLSDPWREVVSIKATLKGTSYSFDLIDKGTLGDRVARDGVWSYDLVLPEKPDARRYGVKIVAYDKNGEIVTVEDEGGKPLPLITETSFEVDP